MADIVGRVAGGDVCPTGIEPERPLPSAARFAEAALIFLLFAVFAGQTPPNVGESHYLAKARHFWDPSWCAGDVFLESREAHYVFSVAIGWLAWVCSLPTAAWLGRLLAWGALAWSWQRLSYAVVARRWWSVLTAACWLALQEHGHMAGEWIVGGIEAKCFAYALVFLALEAMLDNRWTRAWLLLGVATSFHVLVGGWSLLATGVAWTACGRYGPNWRSQFWPLAGAIVLALPGVIPALLLDVDQPAAVVKEAHEIYVYDRLPHHLVFQSLPITLRLRHAALVVTWLAISVLTPCHLVPGRLGQRPLRGFVTAAIGLAISGAAIDLVLDERVEIAAGFLRFYWFRMSDALVPVATALALAAACVRWRPTHPRLATALVVAMLAASLVSLLDATRRHGLAARGEYDPTFRLLVSDGRLDAARLDARMADWRRVCRWARATTSTGTLFVTPRHQQTFKWFAERPEVATVKDVPQDAGSVVEWYDRRANLAYAVPPLGSGYQPHWPHLINSMRRWNCELIMIDTELEPRPPNWEQLFPDSDEPDCLFKVYRVPSAPSVASIPSVPSVPSVP